MFDYIYGMLHCPTYRETYATFLKIDFPRVPFPASPESFRTISEQGEALRRLHLMEDAAIGDTPFPFEGDGDSVVEKISFEPVGGLEGTVLSEGPKHLEVPTPDPSRKRAGGQVGAVGKVWINAEQCFSGVPAVAWEFHIGGYQPAQKWLKDRKGRTLGWDDVRHYQKIIKILAETDRIMGEIVVALA